MKHTFPAYGGIEPLTLNDIDFLSNLLENIVNKSTNQTERKNSKERNKQIVDPISVGAYIHGVRYFSDDIFDSILDKGILCSEYLDRTEDGETFFHADFYISDKPKLLDWQKTLNEVSNQPTQSSDWHSRIKNGGFAPVKGRRSYTAALILNPYIAHSWNQEYESRCNNINSKFIKQILLDEQVSILGGVPSTDIVGMILSDLINPQSIVSALEKRDMYIPIFNTDGIRIY